jgi:hypothetical protein
MYLWLDQSYEGASNHGYQIILIVNKLQHNNRSSKHLLNHQSCMIIWPRNGWKCTWNLEQVWNFSYPPAIFTHLLKDHNKIRYWYVKLDAVLNRALGKLSKSGSYPSFIRKLVANSYWYSRKALYVLQSFWKVLSTTVNHGGSTAS